MSNARVDFSNDAMVFLTFFATILIAFCDGVDFVYPEDPYRRGSSDYYHHGHHQHDHRNYGGYGTRDGGSYVITEDPSVDNNNIGIPVDFAKNLSEYTVSDLLLNFVDGPEDYDKPLLISTRFGDTDESNSERNSAMIPKPAKCMPELQSVKIAESHSPNVLYIPQCTRVERCGGCCSHVLLSCQPTKTDTVTFQVMKTEYTGAKKLKYVGKELILVEKHVSCKCHCKVKAEDCNTYQEYREGECKCVCKNLDEEKKCAKSSSKKLWNPDVCACQCREIMPCSTGYTFDFNECRCIPAQVKRRYILTTDENRPDEPLD
ncbi:vascular endothelial growth factor A-like [Cylas formicarius]|uniref:vascular endothelial growth factor A-like n=1 Tax=Cylas formicarius TaxID=197179 RepID=UPI0029587B26|nr:vascular endothelial growth factor A-like [Cylas formicarius]